MRGMKYLGIEIGGTKLQILIWNGFEIQARHRFEVDRGKGGAGIRQQIEVALGQLVSSTEPAARPSMRT